MTTVDSFESYLLLPFSILLPPVLHYYLNYSLSQLLLRFILCFHFFSHLIHISNQFIAFLHSYFPYHSSFFYSYPLGPFPVVILLTWSHQQETPQCLFSFISEQGLNQLPRRSLYRQPCGVTRQ
jgi:hypothetical protein